MTTLITLIGGQPIPNLLPIRAIKPERALLVHTGTGAHGTQPVAERIARLLKDTPYELVKVPAYDLSKARSTLAEHLAAPGDLCFNLTGGTKIMLLAAYALAAEHAAAFVYLRTEGGAGRNVESILYHYEFQDGQAEQVKQERLPALITLDEYLNAHWEHGYEEAGFDDTEGADFERAIYRALKDDVDEIMVGVKPGGMKEQVEIDLVIRCGNQVGVIEVKRSGKGQSGKKGVDQLTTAAAKDLSGTYTTRFLITGGGERQDYADLAQKSNIRLIRLPSYYQGRLDKRDALRLHQTIFEVLPKPDKRS